MEEDRHGVVAWLVLWGWIVGWDIWAHRHGKPTLTATWKTLTSNKYARIILTAFWGVVTLHLLTERGDPHQIARKLVTERRRRDESPPPDANHH